MRQCVAISGRFFTYVAVTGMLAASVFQVEAKSNLKSSHIRQVNVQTKRRSVIDYFYLLPSVGIGDQTTRREKRELLLPQNHPIIDLRHDYLLVHPDSSPTEEIAVFRARDKVDLLADSMHDYQSDYNFFRLYRLRNGKLQDVTRQMLPIPARTDKLMYTLPRVGTTIRVDRFNIETESHRYAFSLQWRGGHFIKAR